jgi:hypothetical protein
MKLTTLAVIGAVGVAAAMGTETANATPLVGGVAAPAAPGIVQVWGGCGPGWRPTKWGCVRDPHWRGRGPGWRGPGPGPGWRSRHWRRGWW